MNFASSEKIMQDGTKSSFDRYLDWKFHLNIYFLYIFLELTEKSSIITLGMHETINSSTALWRRKIRTRQRLICQDCHYFTRYHITIPEKGRKFLEAMKMNPTNWEKSGILRKNKRMVDRSSGFDGNLQLASCCQRKRFSTV